MAGFALEEQDDVSCLTTGDSETDDDMGFRMYTGGEIETPADLSVGASRPPIKVKNLINFEECDFGEENEPQEPRGTCESSASALEASSAAHSDRGPEAGSNGNAGANETPGGAHPSTSVPESHEVILAEEVQHLLQVLQDMREEKNIEVAIVRDEVALKQQLLEELTVRSAEAESARRKAEAREKLAVQEREEALAHSEMLLQEAAQLRASRDAAEASALEAAGRRRECEPEVTPNLLPMMDEVDSECRKVLAILQEGSPEKESLEVPPVGAGGDAEARARSLLHFATRSLTPAAHRAAESRRRLAEDLRVLLTKEPDRKVESAMEAVRTGHARAALAMPEFDAGRPEASHARSLRLAVATSLKLLTEKTQRVQMRPQGATERAVL